MCTPRLLVLLALLLGSAAAPAAAQGQATATEDVREAVQGLDEDGVWVDPEARDVLDRGGEQAVERAVRSASSPFIVAVLPEKAGEPNAVGQAILDGRQQEGTYLVTVGESLRAASTDLPPGAAGTIAGQVASELRGGGAQAVLTETVQRIDAEIASGGQGSGGGGFAAPRPRDPGAGTGGGGGGLLALLLLGGLGFLAFRFTRGRSRRREEAEHVEDLRRAARDDLVALGDDVRAVDIDVEMPGAPPAAREHLGAALAHYERAETAWDRAKRPEDFQPITKELEEGRWQMACAQAVLRGEPVPERRPPCFFDPRHGPSVRDVEWAPPGGQPRPVPACAADAIRVEEGEEPTSRQVVVGGAHMPYWAAPGWFGAPYAGGFFGGFGGIGAGLLGGMLLHDALTPDAVYGDGFGDGFGGDFGGGFGGGDFGGGGGFGGDFGGGGGFGGGDFGGGDFGGGGDF